MSQYDSERRVDWNTALFGLTLHTSKSPSEVKDPQPEENIDWMVIYKQAKKKERERWGPAAKPPATDVL